MFQNRTYDTADFQLLQVSIMTDLCDTQSWPLVLNFHTVCFLSFCNGAIFQFNITAMTSTESFSQHTSGIKGLNEGNKTISLVIKVITNHNGNCFLKNAVV